MTNQRPTSLQNLGAFLLICLSIAFVVVLNRTKTPEVAVEQKQGSPPEGRKAKRRHNVPPGAIDSRSLAKLVIGDGLSIGRSGPESKIYVGYGVSIVLPKNVQLECRAKDGVFHVTASTGAPYILLPVVGKLWPIGIIAAHLDGDLLTVELDGWTDYQVKIQ